jgi:methionyl-tRNA formyltransferase
MKVVFFGNTKYSVIAAEILQKKLGISLVVTIPDKPKGRSRKLTPSPVKQFALKNKLPLLTTDRLDQTTIKSTSKLHPDFIVVSDYGLILPKELLDLPKYASLNIHHSLLPEYRGPSPAPAVILAGEKKSGVTIIKMTEKVDAGDILAQQEYELEKDETTDSLLTKLNTLGGQLIISVIEQFLKESIKPQTQDEAKASYTYRLKKEDGFIDAKNPPDPQTFDRMVRAFYPWPTVWSRVKVKSGKSMLIKFLPGNLIQPEAKKPMNIKEFLNGYPQAKQLIEKLYPVPTTL